MAQTAISAASKSPDHKKSPFLAGSIIGVKDFLRFSANRRSRNIIGLSIA